MSHGAGNGIRTRDPQLGKPDHSQCSRSQQSQAFSTVTEFGGLEGGPDQTLSQPFTTDASGTIPRVAPVLRASAIPGFARVAIRVLDGGKDHLLTARAVAARLGVSTATVYKLCTRGELAHVRVSNAIRIEPAELEAFIALRRRGEGR